MTNKEATKIVEAGMKTYKEEYKDNKVKIIELLEYISADAFASGFVAGRKHTIALADKAKENDNGN